MATLIISVPNATMEWLEAQAKVEGFPDGREFASHILDGEREMSETLDTAALKRLLRDAEASGVSRRNTDQIFAEAVERAKAGGFDRE